MKVSFRSVIKTPYPRCKWGQERQLLIQAGNTISVNPINKPPIDFIPLNAQNIKLFGFVTSPNNRNIFTAQKISNQNHQTSSGRVKRNQHCIQICLYTLQGERKAFRISEHANYMPVDLIVSVELIADKLESSVVFVVTKSKSQACVSLVDFFKLRLIASGFIGEFQSLKVCSLETYQFSISGKGLMRRFKAQDGVWNFEEKLPKKLCHLNIIRHDWLTDERILMATSSMIYIIDENQISQTLTPITQQDSIHEVIKLGTSLAVVTNKLKVLYYSQGGQQSNKFALEEETSLCPDKPYTQITQVEVNRGQEILISLDNQQFYYSGVTDLAVGSQQHHFSFQKIDLPCSEFTGGDISADQKVFLISTDRTVEVWDLKTIKPLNKLAVSPTRSGETRRCSLNPDGHSFCITIEDKLKFYRILINKFKHYADFPCRNCSLIQYSHGGQLVAFGSGKANNSLLTIVNTLKSEQVYAIKLGFTPSQAIWNEYDNEIYVSGKQVKSVSIFRISSKSKASILNFDEIVSFMRHDYLTGKLLISIGSKIALVGPDYEISWVVPHIPSFHYVFPIQGFYLATDLEGTLYYSSSMDFQRSKSLSVFTKEKFNLQYRTQTLIAYTSPSNCLVIKIDLPPSEAKSNAIQEDSVLVQKSQINKFFDKVKLLENQLEQFQNLTSLKIEEQRKKYNQSLEENAENFKEEIEAVTKRMQETQFNGAKKDKESQRVFEQLETGQMASVNELEKVYDIKIKLHKERYLALEQEKTEQTMKFERLIKGLESKYHNDIQIIREQYSKKMQEGARFSELEKNRGIEYKKKMEAKMINLEEEQELTLYDLQLEKDTQIKSLSEKNVQLERDYDSAMISLHNLEEQIRELKRKCEESDQKLKKNERYVQENISSVKVHEQEIKKKNDIIESKNATIEQQLHQIEGLEKAKYILGFRATEVRKQLEPKESLIEKLKSELFKLDEDFKKEMKNNFELRQKVSKIEKISIATRKERDEIKLALEHKERVHEDMCLEMFLLINNTDPKEWNPKIIKMYQQYVKDNKFASKAQNKKSDNTSQEINRHLIHVEKSLHQVATGNQKILKGRETQVVRKMKQNSELVYDLNVMRKKQNEYIKEIETKEVTIDRLKREIHEVNQGSKSTRVNTAKTGFTRRNVSRDPSSLNNIKNNELIDLSMIKQSDYLIHHRERKDRVFSANKTVYARQETRREKSKIPDLAKQLESAKTTIRRQDRMIEELNQRLLGLPEEQLL